MTISACVLIADWQAIPYDPCTEYSPFHHPDITQNYSIEQSEQSAHYTTKSQAELKVTTMLTNLRLHSDIEMKFTDGSTAKIKLPVDMKFTCEHVDDCECYQHSPEVNKLSSRFCLFYILHNGGKILPIESTLWAEHEHPSNLFSCAMSSTHFQSPSTCVHIYDDSQTHNRSRSKEVLQSSRMIGNIQSLLVLSNFSYYTAKLNCIHANVTNRHCHWTPSSVLTKKECEDCQPICRSREQSLTFVQLILGIIILLASIDIMWVHIAVLASNQVSMSSQVRV